MFAVFTQKDESPIAVNGYLVSEFFKTPGEASTTTICFNDPSGEYFTVVKENFDLVCSAFKAVNPSKPTS